MTTKDIDDFFELVRHASAVLVLTHVNPDGDTIGSGLALAGLLEGMGKSVAVFNTDGAPYQFASLPGAERIVDTPGDLGGFDLICAVDASDSDRFGVGGLAGIRDKLVNIDHHITNDSFGRVNIVDPEASATGEIVYRIAKQGGRPITLSMAKNIYAAIHTDTGSLRYSNSTPASFSILGEMVSLGVKPWDMARALYEDIPMGKLKLMARILGTMEFFCSGKVGVILVALDDFTATGTSKADTDGFINYPRSVIGVEVAVSIREESPREKGLFKVSMRSKGDVDLTGIVVSLGGGGHKYAAGCTIAADSILSARTRIVDLLEKHFAS